MHVSGLTAQRHPPAQSPVKLPELVVAPPALAAPLLAPVPPLVPLVPVLAIVPSSRPLQPRAQTRAIVKILSVERGIGVNVLSKNGAHRNPAKPGRSMSQPVPRLAPRSRSLPAAACPREGNERR